MSGGVVANSNLSRFPEIPATYDFRMTKLQTDRYFKNLPDVPSIAVAKFVNELEFFSIHWCDNYTTPSAVNTYDDVLVAHFENQPIFINSGDQLLMKVDFSMVCAPHNFCKSLNNLYMYAADWDSIPTTGQQFVFPKVSQLLQLPSGYCDDMSQLVKRLNDACSLFEISINEFNGWVEVAPVTETRNPFFIMALGDFDIRKYFNFDFATQGFSSYIYKQNGNNYVLRVTQGGVAATYPSDANSLDFVDDSLPTKLGFIALSHVADGRSTVLVDVPDITAAGTLNPKLRHLILLARNPTSEGNMGGSRLRLHLWCSDMADSNGQPVDALIVDPASWVSRSYCTFYGTWQVLSTKSNCIKELRFALLDDNRRPVEVPPSPQPALKLQFQTIQH